MPLPFGDAERTIHSVLLILADLIALFENLSLHFLIFSQSDQVSENTLNKKYKLLLSP